jgi:hypothetical protein
MDEKFQSILEALPQKSPRSRLEPYQDLINELRRRGRSYRDIERILVEQCHIHTSRSAINDFVRVRSRRKGMKRQADGHSEATARPGEHKANPGNPPKTTSDVEDIYRRIAVFKQQPIETQSTPELFHYDPDEPLHILPKPEKKSF